MRRAIRKAPLTKFPTTMVWSSMLQKWEAASGSHSLRSVPPPREEDATRMIRLRIPPGPPAKGNAAVLADMAPSARSAYEDVASRVRQAIDEILAMNWRVVGIGRMVRALQTRRFPVGHVQVYWMIQGDRRYAFLPAGTNEEIQIALVRSDRWRPVVSEAGTTPAAQGFLRGKW